MLVNFKVSNHLSFKGEAKLSLEAAGIKEFSDLNVFEPKYINNQRLLKSAVLFGANSAGKSNMIKSIEFMQKFVLNSARELQANEPIEVEPFKLNTHTLKQASCFEVEFVFDNKKFRYGFNITKERIVKEYLYDIGRSKNHMYFERVYDKYLIDTNLKEAIGLETKTRSNALFLSVMAQWNVPLATRILRWFQGITFLNDINFKTYFNNTVNVLSDERKKAQLIKLIKIANLGFENVEVRRLKIDEDVLSGLPDEVRKVLSSKSISKPQVFTLHKRFDEHGKHAGFVQFNLAEEESLGTQKYFALSGYILDSLLQGTIIFIDELDARLHSFLSSLIIQFFNSAKDNPLNAQLIFSTHNTNLLSEKILRRDQIYFIDKDEFGSSRLFTLMDLGRRNDASFEKEYLSGEYDAVPFKERPQLNLFDENERLTLF